MNSKTVGRIGLVLLLLILLAAVFAGVLAPYDPTALSGTPFEKPSASHLLGTNDIGQDIFSELLYGARTSLLVGALSTLITLALAVLASAAELCGTDYGAVGVAVMGLMYLLRDRLLAAACLSLVLLVLLSRLELYCIPAFLAIALYNGKRGRQPKYFFYVFYPAHLLLLWAIGSYVLPVWM